MIIRIAAGMPALEMILVLAQSWQSAYLGDGFVEGIDPSSIGNLILISSPSSLPLSDRERRIFYGTLSRLVDE